MITVNRSYLVHMKNEQTVKPLDKALDIKPLRALPCFLGCVGTAAWAAYMTGQIRHMVCSSVTPPQLKALPNESLGKARGALPFDSHLVPGKCCSRLSF